MNKKMFNFKNMVVVAVFALVAFVGFSAFKSAGSEVKPKVASLYWYTVSYDNPTTYPDGYIKSGTLVHDYAEKEDVISPCDDGDQLDCLRGFSTPLLIFPNADLTTPKIQKPNN